MGIEAVFSAPSAQAGADILLATGLTAETANTFTTSLLALSVFSPSDEATSFLQTLRDGRLNVALTRQVAQYIARIPPKIWAQFLLARGATSSGQTTGKRRFADPSTFAPLFKSTHAPRPVQRLTTDGRVVVVMETSGVGERSRHRTSPTDAEETETTAPTLPRTAPLAPPLPTATPLKSFSGKKGSYTVIGNIATAGQGIVLLLQDATGTRYAGKIIRDPRQAKRLRDEEKALTNIDNEHVIRLHDIAKIPHPVWGAVEDVVITEYVDGKTLAQLIQEERRFTETQLREIARQVMDGFQPAHAKGIIHRDIKPSNLMIIEHKNGTFTVKIIDYGLALFTGEARNQSSYSGIKGTFAYTTPEHYLPRLVFTDATDRYGLGLVLIDLIRGTLRDDYFKHDSPLNAIAEFRRTHGSYLSREFLDNLAMLVDENPEVRRRASLSQVQPLSILPQVTVPQSHFSPPLMGGDEGAGATIAAASAGEMIPMGAAQYLQRLHETGGDRRNESDFALRNLWSGLTTGSGLMVTAGALMSYLPNFHESLVLAGIGTPPLLLGLWKQWRLRRLDSYVKASPTALYRDGKVTGATLKEYRKGAIPLHAVDTAKDLERMHAGAHIFLNHVVVENVVLKKSERTEPAKFDGDRIGSPYTVTVLDLSCTIHLPWGDTIQQSLHADALIEPEMAQKFGRFIELFQAGPVSLVGIAQDNGSIKVIHVEKSH